jgi:hypothetical protein
MSSSAPSSLFINPQFADSPSSWRQPPSSVNTGNNSHACGGELPSPSRVLITMWSLYTLLLPSAYPYPFFISFGGEVNPFESFDDEIQDLSSDSLTDDYRDLIDDSAVNEIKVQLIDAGVPELLIDLVYSSCELRLPQHRLSILLLCSSLLNSITAFSFSNDRFKMSGLLSRLVTKTRNFGVFLKPLKDACDYIASIISNQDKHKPFQPRYVLFIRFFFYLFIFILFVLLLFMN